MTQKTKTQIVAEVSGQIPSNTRGAVKAKNVRDVLIDLIDSAAVGTDEITNAGRAFLKEPDAASQRAALELSAVAASNDYGDLDNLPPLGTAAAENVEAFATAGQGAKADTAVQPENLSEVATSGDYTDLNNLPSLGTIASHDTDEFYDPPESDAEYDDSSLLGLDESNPSAPTIVKLPINKILATKSLAQLGATSSMNASAVGDLNSAISTAFASGIRRFDGLDKTYALTGNTGLIIPPGAESFGARFDFSGMSTNTKAILSSGNMGVPSTITLDIGIGDYVCQIANTSGLYEGQPVYLRRDAIFSSAASSAKIGELNRVRKIVDSTTIWLHYPATFEFPVSDNSILYPMITSLDVTVFRDMELIGADIPNYSQYAIYNKYLDGVIVERVNTYKFDTANCVFHRCFHPRGIRNSFRRSRGNLGYGYENVFGTRDSQISGGDAAQMRHGHASGSGSDSGINIDISISGLHCSNMADAGIDFHSPTVGCYADRCVIEGDAGQRDVEFGVGTSDGIISQGINTRITDCIVKNISGTGIRLQPLVDNHPVSGGGYAIIDGGYAENCAQEGASIYMANAGITLDKGQILDFIARGCDRSAVGGSVRVYVSTGAQIRDLLIRSPRIDNAGTIAVWVRAINGGVIGRSEIIDPVSNNSATFDIYHQVDGGAVDEFSVRGGKLNAAGSGTAQFYCLASNGGSIGKIDIDGTKLNNSVRGLYLRATGSGSTIGLARVNGMQVRGQTEDSLFAQADGGGSFAQVQFFGNDTDGGKIGLRTSAVTKVVTDGRNALGNHSVAKRQFSTATELHLGDDGGVQQIASVGASTYTVADGIKFIECNSASDVTLTLPSASLYPNRTLHVITQTAKAVISSSSNVVPSVGGSAGTAILSATSGAWATIRSNGTNWLVTSTAKPIPVYESPVSFAHISDADLSTCSVQSGALNVASVTQSSGEYAVTFVSALPSSDYFVFAQITDAGASNDLIFVNLSRSITGFTLQCRRGSTGALQACNAFDFRVY